MRVGVIGAGPYFWARHFPYLQRSGADIRFVIDLQAREERLTALVNEFVPAAVLILLPNQVRAERRLPRNLPQRLREILGDELHSLDKLVIASEPTGRGVWLECAAMLAVPTYVDKPLIAVPGSSVDGREAQTYLSEIERLRTVCAGKPISIGIDRPFQPGFRALFAAVKRCTGASGYEICRIDARYSAGTFMQMTEVETYENHPFRYGYGALFHSGVHIVDVVHRLIRGCSDFMDGPITVSARAFPSHWGDLHAADSANPGPSGKLSGDRGFGEKGTDAVLDFSNGSRIIRAVCRIDAGGFSMRQPRAPVINEYTDLGRCRFETYEVEIGPAAKIVFEGVNSRIAGLAANEESLRIYRNPGLTGGENPYERITPIVDKPLPEPLERFFQAGSTGVNVEECFESHRLIGLLSLSLARRSRLETMILP